jgi:very-short-patch-repair endonuclease
MVMVEYLVFFGLIAVAVVLFVRHEIWEKRHPSQSLSFDWEYAKCESPIERKLYEALTWSGYNVKAQYVVPPARYRIDLALPQYKIAIECDGRAYHSTPEQKRHDQKKDAYLRRKGWKVLRFPGSVIHANVGDVIQQIEEEIRRTI